MARAFQQPAELIIAADGGSPRRSAAEGHAKLLNMRDFRASSGFPPAVKTRYNRVSGKPAKAVGLALFLPLWLFRPRTAIGWAKFRAYMLQTFMM
jgi:hypothetical protein